MHDEARGAGEAEHEEESSFLEKQGHFSHSGRTEGKSGSCAGTAGDRRVPFLREAEALSLMRLRIRRKTSIARILAASGEH